jgi:NADH:ubiquinone oxidoreductase subunit H
MFIFIGALIGLVLLGSFQPFSDAIRLFSREQYFHLVSNYLSYHFSPVFWGYFLLC